MTFSKMHRGLKYALFAPLLFVSFQNFSPIDLDIDQRPKPVREANRLQNKPSGTSLILQGEGGASRSTILTLPVFPEYHPSSSLLLPQRSYSTGYRPDLSNEMIQQKLDSLEKSMNFKFQNLQAPSAGGKGTLSVQLLDRNGQGHFSFDGPVRVAYDVDFLKANSQLLASKQVGSNVNLNLRYRPQERNGGVGLSWGW